MKKRISLLTLLLSLPLHAGGGPDDKEEVTPGCCSQFTAAAGAAFIALIKTIVEYPAPDETDLNTQISIDSTLPMPISSSGNILKCHDQDKKNK